ncbi:divalent cation tolerance protein, CutA1 family [Onchocerca flexuosa]|uniref:Divalent cation tolerance protein, CutA1 family n=1 Tax=Onchocerca flexuosa TaxID=387005 RepID=A0A238C082_9BILA|nr:divalent cation tolerance protein, CutA1 family [Onchocerca flexuosa]
MNTMFRMVIIVCVFLVACQLCVQFMAATRSVGQALYSVVYVTVPNSTVAQQIAREVVKGKYAACVNIVPTITSIYEWENELQEDKESLLIMKTKSAALDALKTKVLSMHPYKVPEFIASPIENGSESYLQWIDKQVNS